jgi:CBS domain-containing membrane protein
MAKPLVVADIMTCSPKTLSVNETLTTAKKMMNSCGIRHIPVTEKREVVAILSERDIRLAETIYSRAALNDVLVKQICVFDPYVVEENTDLVTMLNYLAKKKLGSALVVKNGHLTGIVTTIDICRAFAKVLR